MARQLPLPLPTKSALGRDNFFVSEANQMAVAALEATQTWSNGKLMLCGPAASGKTHLAHVWAGENNAQIIGAQTLATQDIATIATTALVVEDVDRAQPQDETPLFHLHNLMLAEGHALLMTTTTPPAQMATRLPDLKSRLTGTTLVALDPPDDALLAVVLMKMFADRQINLPAGLLDYVVPRITRSFAEARRFVDEMDARALSEARPIGKRLAGDILGGT